MVGNKALLSDGTGAISLLEKTDSRTDVACCWSAVIDGADPVLPAGASVTAPREVIGSLGTRMCRRCPDSVRQDQRCPHVLVH